MNNNKSYLDYLTEKEVEFLSDWLSEDLKLQEKEQTINDKSKETLKNIVTKLLKLGVTQENKLINDKVNLVKCIQDLDNYFVETIDNMSMYHHNQGLSEDDLKSNLANILENNGCYELVRETKNDE